MTQGSCIMLIQMVLASIKDTLDSIGCELPAYAGSGDVQYDVVNGWFEDSVDGTEIGLGEIMKYCDTGTQYNDFATVLLASEAAADLFIDLWAARVNFGTDTISTLIAELDAN